MRRLALKFIQPFLPEPPIVDVDIVATVDVSSLPANAGDRLSEFLSAAAGQWLSNYGQGNASVTVTIEAPP